jgi:TRAP-type C4-dicarboxylate transport system substrate-binding protein
MLVPGPVTRPNKLALKTSELVDKSKWSDLPPREREKIENVMRQRNAEGRGELVRQYHKKLAEDTRGEE